MSDPHPARTEIERLVGRPESTLGSMVDATPSCLKIVDQAGRLLMMNAQGLEMIEAPSFEAVQGCDVLELVEESHRLRFEAFHKRVCTGARERLEFELVGLNGTRRWMETWAAPYRLTNGETAHIAITNDISERREIETTLEAQRSALELASRHAALGELAAGLAHEINNPLGMIAGLAGLIRHDLDNGAAASGDLDRHLTLIEDTVARISGITTALRTFSTDVPADARETCRLADVIRDTVGLCAEKCRMRSIDVQVEVSDSLQVQINRIHFSQVLMNLLTNALQALEDAGNGDPKWIRIRAFAAGERVTIEFSDSGPGVDPAHADKVMTPFFTTKPPGQGTGLGLSISLGIMQGHGGSLRLEQRDEGSCFVLELPAQAETEC